MNPVKPLIPHQTDAAADLRRRVEELRHAQAERAEALERFTDFYDFSPVGLFTLKQDGAIAQVDLTGARLLGMERSRLIDRHFAAFVAESGRPALGDFLQRVFAGDARQICKLELVIGGQPPRAVQLNAMLAPDRQECRAAVVDITEQKQVERELRESERRFRDVADISADWIWEVDMAGRYTYASESVRALLGYAPQDIIGKTAFDLMPPDEAVRAQEVFAAIAMRGESFRDLENIVLDSRGGRHDTLTNGTPMLDAAGKMIGYRGVDRDITKRRRAEEALKLSQQRFRDIVNTTEGIVWEADARSFDFTYVSRQAERLLGFPVEEWRQPGFWVKNLYPDDREWALEYCQSCTRRMAAHDFEYRFVARDGRTVWLHDIVTVVKEDGAPRWLRGIMMDITARKQAEQALREMADGLEQKVAERTRQLRQLAAQLTVVEERERRKLAQDLHDDLGQLLAVIRIKLNAIEAGAPKLPIDSVLGLVKQAEESVRTITSQLSPPVLHTLGLVPALEWLGEEIERVYGLRVHVDHDHCPKHLLDEVQAVLYRSARELLINAAKHARVDEVSLSCMCQCDRLLLVVSDAGCGFDPGAHMDQWPVHQGFGLRSINERICNLGGEMEIDSSPGNGTTITLSVACSSIEREICDDPRNACG